MARKNNTKDKAQPGVNRGMRGRQLLRFIAHLRETDISSDKITAAMETDPGLLFAKHLASNVPQEDSSQDNEEEEEERFPPSWPARGTFKSWINGSYKAWREESIRNKSFDPVAAAAREKKQQEKEKATLEINNNTAAGGSDHGSGERHQDPAGGDHLPGNNVPTPSPDGHVQSSDKSPSPSMNPKRSHLPSTGPSTVALGAKPVEFQPKLPVSPVPPALEKPKIPPVQHAASAGHSTVSSGMPPAQHDKRPVPSASSPEDLHRPYPGKSSTPPVQPPLPTTDHQAPQATSTTSTVYGHRTFTYFDSDGFPGEPRPPTPRPNIRDALLPQSCRPEPRVLVVHNNPPPPRSDKGSAPVPNDAEQTRAKTIDHRYVPSGANPDTYSGHAIPGLAPAQASGKQPSFGPTLAPDTGKGTAAASSTGISAVAGPATVIGPSGGGGGTALTRENLLRNAAAHRNAGSAAEMRERDAAGAAGAVGRGDPEVNGDWYRWYAEVHNRKRREG
ncbi:hypothetical protein QBC33DRAFT_623905 [Phialemonium atrogriseum]|uniref:Uncharacterized protein n=1 Tax=Phialemonium atrogriseum TaxID=1093897 RepID=A0AAJ0BPL1_9PEZI|nr:uncharacterized protein QBC33DRAFT_623905 [Phialemonium atrogriseum]KAK1762144.1 hypothetical protein QBC33DRAFT_623905 [Phialemonium atrogriseum]